MHPNIVKQANLLAYLTAGHANFTAQGRENRFTYRITKPKFKDGSSSDHIRFIKVLTGSCNESSYAFVGTLVKKFGRWEYRHSNKSRISKDALSVVALTYILNKVVSGLPLSRSVEIWHDGTCGHCGRKLTVPESIETGLGPVCAKVV